MIQISKQTTITFRCLSQINSTVHGYDRITRAATSLLLPYSCLQRTRLLLFRGQPLKSHCFVTCRVNDAREDRMVRMHYKLREDPKSGDLINARNTWNLSTGNAVGTMTGLRAGQERKCGSNTGRQKRFLGAFANLRKENISFIMTVYASVRSSVRREQCGSHIKGFR